MEVRLTVLVPGQPCPSFWLCLSWVMCPQYPVASFYFGHSFWAGGWIFLHKPLSPFFPGQLCMGLEPVICPLSGIFPPRGHLVFVCMGCILIQWRAVTWKDSAPSEPGCIHSHYLLYLGTLAHQLPWASLTILNSPI